MPDDPEVFADLAAARVNDDKRTGYQRKAGGDLRGTKEGDLLAAELLTQRIAYVRRGDKNETVADFHGRWLAGLGLKYWKKATEEGLDRNYPANWLMITREQLTRVGRHLVAKANDLPDNEKSETDYPYGWRDALSAFKETP